MSAKTSALSDTYTRWMTEALGRTFASEPKSTCGDCAMCKTPATGLSKSFSPSTKCCTYWPDLPNFLVGRALLAGGEGAARLRDQIARRVGLTPFGLQSSPRYHRRYVESPGKFGSDAELLCPYYDGGDCTIWASRNAVCQTYFCRVEDGLPGHEVWRQLTTLLLLVEEQLAVDCATRRLSHPGFYTAGFQVNGTRHQVTTRSFAGWIEEDGTISRELHSELWGEWEGREVAFFEACAADVEPLSWADVLARVGPRGQALTRRLDAMTALQAPLYLRPARPGLELEYEEASGDMAYISAQGSFEVHLAPASLWDALSEFGGGPLTDDGLALPERVMPLEEAVALWKTGLLVEGEPVAEKPMEPGDRLRFVAGLPKNERILFSETGVASIVLRVGSTELTFDEPDLLNFARTLYSRHQGFVAEEAQVWVGRSWEETADLLESLLGVGVLERIINPE